ncbi:hypothetical protein Acor_06830 [Acrocarpospora corrugata]|uniref:Uncharacterized protein n=1 Tax=Acrocarpospora corrugata TaxID=35763 RepID=A0A5M3VSL3_9ACTN|nr:hypothetical protein [Acrocarpospora corrugata]GER98621.1 hypothetical protein Acor_06830 [Acrocarpospora corrugata]
MTTDLDRIVSRLARDPGPGLTPGARELLDEITRMPAAMPVPAARIRRRKTMALVPAVFAVVLAWALTAPAQAALDIQREGAFFTVVVKDMYADPTVFNAELRSAGVPIQFHTLPVSPSRVGSIIDDGTATPPDAAGPELPWSSGPGRIEPLGPCAASEPCVLGIRIPVTARVQTVIRLGRPAQPGEVYRSAANLDMPGELLHCVPFVNRTVSEVGSLMTVRGVRHVKWVDLKAGLELDPPGSWFVHEGRAYSDDTVLFFVGATRSAATDAC